MAVSADGIIVWVEGNVPHDDISAVALKHGWDTSGSSKIQLVETHEGEWIMPGFIDTHTHAPQYLNLGSGQQYELLDWLDNITWPAETRFLDVNYAKTTYEDVVSRLLNVGTTTCCYYASLHAASSKVLADIAHAKGQRAFIGKCNMDRNSPPTYIEENVDKSIQDTLSVIDHISKLDPPSEGAKPGYFPLVQAIITPRFAISCTDDLLSAVGKLFVGSLRREDAPPLPLQTHISESLAEVSQTLEIFKHLPPPSASAKPFPPSHPRDKNTYTSIYDYFDLLDHRTILGHGIHLSEGELDLIKAREVGLSHCAGSNFNLRSGVASVKKWLDKGIKVGLGTDVSGGFAPSILNEIRHASIASKVRAMMDNPPDEPKNTGSANPAGLSIPTLLYLATLGGASLCNLSERVGSFVAGKEFDAILVSLSRSPSTPLSMANPGIWYDGKDGPESLLERFFFCGDDRNIRRVWVRGRLVGGTDHRLSG